MNTTRMQQKNVVTTLTGTQFLKIPFNKSLLWTLNIQFYGTEVAFSHNIFRAAWFLHFLVLYKNVEACKDYYCAPVL